MLFRWFLDMDMVEDVFDRSTFSKNRERMLKHEVTPHEGPGLGLVVYLVAAITILTYWLSD